ncbi:hypothetical protein GLA29479_4998 [Lysobacter antibioticus]|uniref:hypothetical protein n=1 Tax=Lysobacter antibioticus TaxID=84531 RepID=UPI000716ED16|nr:hypothetical protein [Lysobacter antibioticus]ALN65824.1 hypothetical protein GLA29479_4998 [Lysobacter antibioticus]
MRRTRAVWPFVLSLLSLPAFAAAPPCGSYVADDSPDRLIFDGSRVELRDEEGFLSEFSPYAYRVEGDTLWLRSGDSNLLKTYTIESDGRLIQQADRFDNGGAVYKQVAKAQCQPASVQVVAVAPNQGKERGDDQKDCALGDVQSCVAAIEYDNSLAPTQRAAKLETYCRRDRSPYACKQWVKALSAEEDGAPLYLFRTKRLPEAGLAALRVSCRDIGYGEACESLADQQWLAGRYADARDSFAFACDGKLSKEACKRVEELRGLSLRNDAPRQSPRQPCGSYASADIESSLFGLFRFGDGQGATVSEEGEFDMRYRLLEDEVLVRHDKGDDFVLRWLDADTLIGMDEWTRYKSYRRIESAQCEAIAMPVAGKQVRETPYKVDHCALTDPGGAAACCAKGSMSACMGEGHMAALNNYWAKAAGFYDKVCAMHVREGCGNLVAAYHNTGDDKLLAGIRKVCADTPDSVACEELQLASPQQVEEKRLERELAQELQKLLQEGAKDGESQEAAEGER